MKVVYVVLHFLAYNDTIECVNSMLKNILPNTKHELQIVIVDNGSTNDSFKILKEQYKDCNLVKLVRNKTNLGFAKGNNVGFQYAKYKIGADFIVLINNDTIINQHDFSDVLVDKYNEKKYYVLGPDIVTDDGYHQNPGNKQSWGLMELILFRLKKRFRLLSSYTHILRKSSKYINGTNDHYLSVSRKGDVENTILHGACMVFSPEYINRFDGLYPDTFLYMEEDILKLLSDYYGFMMLYSSDLRINHKEDVATNMVQIKSVDRIRQKLRFLIQSSKIYSKLKLKMMVKKLLVKLIEKIATKVKRDGAEFKIDLDIPLLYLLSIVITRIIMVGRANFKCLGVKKSGKFVFLGKDVKLKCKSKISLGNGVSLQNRVYIDALSRSGVTIGDSCSIGSGSVIRCSGNLKNIGVGFYMGNHSSLADNCFVGATGGVYIGDNVIGGQNIRFHSSNHVFSDPNELIRKQGIKSKGIRIGNDCWIGAGVVFCDGVSIGDGCVIGTNSVVTKSFPNNCVVAGNPAKTIRKR